jgi:hypothetical protein
VLTPFDEGFVVGLLLTQGSFGGDGRQPQVTLRLHVRHEGVVRRLAELFPRSRVYGPYHHGERSYVQWMARGPALVHDVLPLLERHLTPDLDAHAAERLAVMVERYAEQIARERGRAG